MNTILVTGGAGFIGSHTCLILLEQGYRVCVLDSFINSNPNSLKKVLLILDKKNINYRNRINIFNGDLRNIDSIRNVFFNAIKNRNKIDAVIHFAGLKSVENSIKNPINYWEANVLTTLNLLRVMNENNCATIVFSSSACIYGNVEKLANEKSNINPTNTYGTTKFVIENLLKNVSNSSPNKWKVANLRYFNPIGAHSSGLIGEDPKGLPTNIFPTITKVAVGKINKLEIFGNSWPTADKTGVRDYIHIMDLAEGHIRTLKFLLARECKYINLNIGTGIGTSVLELVHTFERVNKVNIPFIFSPKRNGDVAEVVADISLLKKTLNWFPKKNIEDMCRDGFNWQLKSPNGYDS